jgi:hypothetical protein
MIQDNGYRIKRRNADPGKNNPKDQNPHGNHQDNVKDFRDGDQKVGE